MGKKNVCRRVFNSMPDLGDGVYVVKTISRAHAEGWLKQCFGDQGEFDEALVITGTGTHVEPQFTLIVRVDKVTWGYEGDVSPEHLELIRGESGETSLGVYGGGAAGEQIF